MYPTLTVDGYAYSGGFLAQGVFRVSDVPVATMTRMGELYFGMSGSCIGKTTDYIAFSPYVGNASISAQMNITTGIFNRCQAIAGAPATNAFYGAVRLPNGLIMWVPYGYAKIGLYDPVLNTYADGPSHGEGANAFTCGVLVPGGKVVMGPRNSDHIGIYNTKDTGMTWNQCAAPWFNKS